jgi:hypothetical protein
MKNHKSLLYPIIIAAILATNGCNPGGGEKHEEKASASTVTFENGAAIPEYDKQKLQTYEMAATAKTDEAAAMKNVNQLLEYAAATKEFDLANPIKENGLLFYKNPKDPSANININLENGDISLNRGTNAYMGNKSTDGLVKNDEAVKMAQEHIRKLGYAANEENTMFVGHVGGVNMTIHDDKDGDKIYEKLTTVRFDRKLGDIPVLGHTRILVQMGEKGTIQSLIKQWAPVNGTAVNTESIVNRDSIKKRIEDHLTGENPGAVKIVVSKVNLIYYDDGKGIIEPALHIIGAVMMHKSDKDSTLVSFKHDMVEPLLKNPRLTYTFMGEQHAKAGSDAIDNKK